VKGRNHKKRKQKKRIRFSCSVVCRFVA